jgi:GNAT superfamily N-acetyltransferase
MSFSFTTADKEEITPALAHAYSALLSQLKDRPCEVAPEDLAEVSRNSNSELLLFMRDEAGGVIGTAQASFQWVPLTYGAYINNVVVDAKYRGQGLGATLMEELEKRSRERWSKLRKFMLTSSPKKGTQGFYLKLGYRMRTKEAGDETIVYVKEA